MLPAFHGQRIRAYESVIQSATDDAIDSWPVGETFSLLPSMQAITLEVIARAVFGVTDERRRSEFKRRIRAMLDPVSNRFSMLLFVLSGQRFGGGGGIERFEERRRALDELIYDEIARRRDAPDLNERDDVFSTLLLARDEDGEEMTDVELRDELVTLLVAGHETTATGLAWAFDLLLHDEPALTRLRETLATGDESYLDAAVKETLRIRPVIPAVGRVVRDEPFQLNGYRIPPGVEINPSIVVMHRRGDRYPEPSRFMPERFLAPDPPDTYTWIPFGGGSRRCLGASFASFEMRVVIGRVLERTALEPGGGPESIERRGITQMPKDGVRVVQTRPPVQSSQRVPARVGA
jgi:cytochrome P450